MKINKRLFPVKAHFFFFMAASGPILPYLTVYGKQLGISEVLMGSITAVVPVTFLLAKPVFGLIADYFYKRRKLVFMALITSMGGFYLGLYFISPRDIRLNHFNLGVNVSGVRLCDKTETGHEVESIKCNATCPIGCRILGMETSKDFCYRFEACNEKEVSVECLNNCIVSTVDEERLFRSVEFYGFLFLMTLSMIAFNVSNSISDAICFDVLGEGSERKYGYQRVWGTVGFGITALLGGLGMDFWSGSDTENKNYTLAFVLVFVFTCVDLVCCLKLKVTPASYWLVPQKEQSQANKSRSLVGARKLREQFVLSFNAHNTNLLPKMVPSENIFKDLSKVLKNKFVFIFLIFATFIGILDGFLMHFMFWFLEDLAEDTNEMKRIKALEGLTVAAETLGGEIIFFLLSGKILEKLGYGHTLTLCFFNYALRFGFISLISNPWWILPIELLMQGPTYALCYTTIVVYASAISPPGTSATMQGIVAGMDDGFGYALGSLAGGFLYRAIGGRLAFQVFSSLAVICCIAHMILYRLFHGESCDQEKEYKPPGEAIQMV